MDKNSEIRKWIHFFATPYVLHITFPLLMIYLIAGTIAQKYIGLYEATKLFFTDPILWIWLIPFPGMPIILGIICINLFLNMLLKHPWRLEKAGIFLAHLATLLLLIGGVITGILSKEGYIILSTNKEKAFFKDYYSSTLVIRDSDKKIVSKLEHDSLKENQSLDFKPLPLAGKILEYCKNCKINERQDKSPLYKGMAKAMQLSKDQLKKNAEENLAGLTLKLSSNGKELAIFTLLEGISQNPKVIINGTIFTLSLEKEKTQLPFSLTLNEFKKTAYQGTDLAQAYQSIVTISESDQQFKTLIEMNSPLRYKDYIFYQSSFLVDETGIYSVLAVVKNAGRLFPYISAILLCFGLLLHMFVRKKYA